jgi:hypothetical protein
MAGTLLVFRFRTKAPNSTPYGLSQVESRIRGCTGWDAVSPYSRLYNPLAQTLYRAGQLDLRISEYLYGPVLFQRWLSLGSPTLGLLVAGSPFGSR